MSKMESPAEIDMASGKLLSRLFLTISISEFVSELARCLWPRFLKLVDGIKIRDSV